MQDISRKTFSGVLLQSFDIYSVLTLLDFSFQAIELDPTNLIFHTNLAAVYFEMKNLDEVSNINSYFFVN